MDKEGLLLCAKYAASPNFFGFCGPAESSSLIDHLREDVADRELSLILSEFETLYPYLKLVSQENKITNPFDKRVVEAYWLGNSLLENIPKRDYLYFLTELLRIDKKLNKETFRKIKGKISTYPFLPHHSSHVFNIFKRTGKDFSFHTLQTMDECRIGWGKIEEVSAGGGSASLGKSENLPAQAGLRVKSFSLSQENGKLALGVKKLKEIKVDYGGKRLIGNLKVGYWVSFHWSFVCDVLSERQVKNLRYYTQKSIDFFNSSDL